MYRFSRQFDASIGKRPQTHRRAILDYKASNAAADSRMDVDGGRLQAQTASDWMDGVRAPGVVACE